MSVIKDLHVVIYRIRQKGLEVFLVNQDLEGDNWNLPQANAQGNMQPLDEAIELDPIKKDNETHRAIAVEGDWHDIPSLKSLIKKDVKLVAGKVFDELEKHGTYFAVKDAIKKMLPTPQYAFLKELKEIISEKNSVENL